MFFKWQEATRKDIEQAIGVVQCKFQILVKKMELLWYVGDNANVVNTTIMLHNTMVAQRIDNKKTKCESFYDVPANLEVNEEE